MGGPVNFNIGGGIVNIQNVRRLKRLSLDPQILGTLLALNTTIIIESKLPLDAKMVSCDEDVRSNRLSLMYESEEFDLIKEGEVVPELPWDTVRFIDEGFCEECADKRIIPPYKG